VLVARLRAALVEAAIRRGAAFVRNVTAIEGQFAQRRKPSRHPHTNMAKAALNMLTRTIADSFAKERVIVCSVDPGWVSPQNPFAQDAAMRASGFAPPLDAEDGAARVLDPVFRAKNGEPVEHGALFKDFVVAPW
jgi:NAD(P)-dependent dehydrogenase (short-subunit alcohol dehydrogenase family)